MLAISTCSWHFARQYISSWLRKAGCSIWRRESLAETGVPAAAAAGSIETRLAAKNNQIRRRRRAAGGSRGGLPLAARNGSRMAVWQRGQSLRSGWLQWPSRESCGQATARHHSIVTAAISRKLAVPKSACLYRRMRREETCCQLLGLDAKLALVAHAWRRKPKLFSIQIKRLSVCRRKRSARPRLAASRLRTKA